MVLDGRCEYSLESDIYYEYDIEIELVVGSSVIPILSFLCLSAVDVIVVRVDGVLGACLR